MLDFWTAVWWENTCSGLDRRTKQINVLNTELEDSRRVTEELQQAFVHWLPDVSGKSPLYDCTVLVVLYIWFIDVSQRPWRTSRTRPASRMQMQRAGPRTLKNFIRHSSPPKQSLLGFEQVFCRRLWRLAPKHCQVLGDVQKRMSLFDAELKDARKLTEKMQQEMSVAVWGSMKSDSETRRRIQKLNVPLATFRIPRWLLRIDQVRPRKTWCWIGPTEKFNQ